MGFAADTVTDALGASDRPRPHQPPSLTYNWSQITSKVPFSMDILMTIADFQDHIRRGRGHGQGLRSGHNTPQRVTWGLRAHFRLQGFSGQREHLWDGSFLHSSESRSPSNGHRGLWPCPNPTTSLVSLPVAAPSLTLPGPCRSLSVAWTCGAARTSLRRAQPYPREPRDLFRPRPLLPTPQALSSWHLLLFNTFSNALVSFTGCLSQDQGIRAEEINKGNFS